MKRFKYKLTASIIAFVSIMIFLATCAIVISLIKLFGPPIFESMFPALDIITIIVSLIFIFILILILNLHYTVSNYGIMLKVGFLKLKKHSILSQDIQGVVYKTKSNTLLIIKDLSAEVICGKAINISPDQFNCFVDQLKNSNVSFDYIEDSN